jgi:hypothetical protein
LELDIVVVPVVLPKLPEFPVPRNVVGSIKQFVPVKFTTVESNTVQLSKLEFVTVELSIIELFIFQNTDKVEFVIVVVPVVEAVTDCTSDGE